MVQEKSSFEIGYTGKLKKLLLILLPGTIWKNNNARMHIHAHTHTRSHRHANTRPHTHTLQMSWKNRMRIFFFSSCVARQTERLSLSGKMSRVTWRFLNLLLILEKEKGNENMWHLSIGFECLLYDKKNCRGERLCIILKTFCILTSVFPLEA